MKLKFTLLLTILSITMTYSQLVLTEIMYNPPESGTDSLEFLEFYNAGPDGINLDGYQVTEGVVYTFPNRMLGPGEYYTIGVDTLGMFRATGIALSDQWESGGLSNGGESIVVVDNNSNTVISVTYDDADPWPGEAEGTDGEGGSIELCDVMADPTDGANWKTSTGSAGVMINEKELLATIGSANSATCATGPEPTLVELVGLEFIPADITINQGETVRWMNTGGRHNVNGSTDTYPDNPEGFRSGDPSSELFTYEYTFTIPGTYSYQCDPHVGVGMIGTVTVMEVMEDRPELVITEVMYNDPGMPDTIEFIEIYNAGSEIADLEGLILKEAVSHTFEAGTVAPGDFIVIAKSSSAMNEFLGFSTALQWTSGGLDNRGEKIILTTAADDTIDIVDYEDLAPWPGGDGNGSSIVLCDFSAENEGPDAWGEATTPTDGMIDGVAILANPGSGSFCSATVEEATMLDEQGAAINEGKDYTLQGVVHSPNFRPSGLTFILIDDAGDGITVFSNSDNLGYDVMMGDEVQVIGSISQFNGLTQIAADEVVVVSSGNALMEPTVVTALSEATESQLITLENLTLVNPEDWGGTGSGFNVDVTNGTETFDLRIDADIDLFDMQYPTGTFSVTGVGGQFDGSSPFDSGYQILPRSMMDIDPYVPFVDMFPARNIADVSTVDANGVTDSLGINCSIRGIVYGPNYRPSGLQFTIIDADGNGIGLFNNTGDLGYTVNEGDEVEVKGSIGQFRGLTQINPEEVTLISSGNDLVAARDVTALGEDTESELVTFNNVTYVDMTEWAGDGSSFNVNMMTEGGQTIVMRIDNDNELSTMEAPAAPFNLTGLGGQFDTEEPLLDGYQILPRYAADIDQSSNTTDILTTDDLNIYPNPTTDELIVDTDHRVISITLFSYDGRRLITQKNKLMNVGHLENGLYLLEVITEEGARIQQVTKY